MKKILSILLCLAVLLSLAVVASATTVDKKYTFSDYTAGTQYATDEVHELDNIITVTTTDAHFTSQLRLYDSASHDSIAIISSTAVLDKIVLNAGNKAATLNVYGSKDGSNWTLLKELSVEKTYADYTVEIGESNGYTYLKLDSVGNQVRVAYMTISYIDNNHTHDSSVTGSDENGHWTECSCGENKSAVSAHDYKNHICTVCGYIGNPTTVEELLKCAYDLPHQATIPGTKTLTGKIISVDESWNTEFSNITVTIEIEGYDKYPIKCYRLASGKADASKLVVGDTITVSGTITKFYESAQFAAGSTLDAHTIHTHEYEGATCTTLAKCKHCGAEEPNGKYAHKPGDAATCTTPQFCTECKAELAPAAGHKDADKNMKCDVCKVNLCTEHKWVDASCTAPKTCSACGQTEGEKLTHVWDEGKITTEATTEKEGVKTYTCTLCKDTKEEKIDKLAPAAPAYVKVTNGKLTSGTYILIANNGYAPTTYSNKWFLAAKPTVSGNKVTDAQGAILTLTVDGDKVTIKDSEGNVIMFTSGTNLQAADGQWHWKYNAATGTFTFDNGEEGEKLRYLASNSGSDNKFRAYTGPFDAADKWGNSYSNQFTVYKLTTSPADTGDTTISIAFAALLASAMGAVVIINKKKDF